MAAPLVRLDALSRGMHHAPRLSIVIPTLNEARQLAATLGALRTAQAVEAIVVDGGSTDGTLEQAERCGARVLRARRGRASQMNAGARAALAELLIFLHADTLLPDQFETHVRSILSTPGVVAGAFRLGIDGPSAHLRIMETVANWRSRRLQFPYGDQAIFLPADRFREIGGYPEVPIMEDFELIRRLRRLGRIAVAPRAVRTSARRWERLGPWRAWLINQTAIAAYLAGVSPARIAGWYTRPGGTRRNARVESARAHASSRVRSSARNV